MKHLTPLVLSLLLSMPLFAQEQQKMDLAFSNVSHTNDSIPTLSLDLSYKDVKDVAFIIAYANNYFETSKILVNERSKEHIYIGFNYNF